MDVDLSLELNRAPRVLVADDDWLTRDLLETHLVAAGHIQREYFSYQMGIGYQAVQTQAQQDNAYQRV